MNKRWIISIIAIIIIWGAGAYGIYFLSSYIPGQLNEPSMILSSESTEDAKQQPESRALKEIIHDTQKLVVKIELADGSLGSGFLFNDNGDIMTNAHVVSGVKNVTVTTADSREFQGTVIGISVDTDVAIVRVAELKGTEPLIMRTDKNAEIGDEVLALGNPLGFENTVTTGIISGIDRDFDLEPYHYEDVYQISAPIAPGNSGGPLIHMKTGEVLGINSAGTNQGSIGFSIPIANVIALVEQWSETPMTSLPNLNQKTDSNDVEENQYASDEELALFLVNYFYESINYDDFVTAYSLLGSSWQATTPYEDFRNGYLYTELITVEDMAVNTNGEQIEVVAIITAEERTDDDTKDSNTYHKYKMTYTVGYENDQMKLITGESTEIN